MIPHPRNGQSVNDVFANRTKWMLLDRSKISFYGDECDKVRAPCHGSLKQNCRMNIMPAPAADSSKS
jgi:hypothetical protein